jgi:FtsZ-binding cell division protein ZapB
MGRHLTQISIETLKDGYLKDKGHYPTWLGQAFGWAGQQGVYHIFDSLYSFIDDMMPDWFPLNIVQDIMMAVCAGVYALIDKWFYGDWADTGDQIVGKFDEVINDYKARVNQAVQDARALVEREFITPLKNQVTTLTLKTNQAQSKLDELNALIKKAEDTLGSHDARIRALEEKAGQPLNLQNLFQKGMLP